MCDTKSPFFSGKSSFCPPCPQPPCFLQITSFSKPLILVGNPDPALIFANLNFPHQFEFFTFCCSKQEKQPMAEQMKIQPGARPSSGWVSFFGSWRELLLWWFCEQVPVPPCTPCSAREAVGIIALKESPWEAVKRLFNLTEDKHRSVSFECFSYFHRQNLWAG